MCLIAGIHGETAQPDARSADTITVQPNVAHMWRHIDFGGNSWTIGSFSTTVDWYNHFWRFRNGTLHWAGHGETHSDNMYLENGATFVFDPGSSYVASINHGSPDRWHVQSGSTLKMHGDVQFYNINVAIEDGGVMDFKPTSIKFGWTAQNSVFANSGWLYATNGLPIAEGILGADGVIGSFTIRQNAGTFVMGGAFAKNGNTGNFYAEFAGGTIHVVEDVTFDLTSV